MAFDIKIQNGDIAFDAQGRIELVRNNNKLVQEVLKLINTTLGYDPFDPSYGISATTNTLGSISTSSVTSQRLESEITRGLQRLKAEQLSLERQQILTPGERIENINSIIVEQDETDPRQYNIFIELTTGEQTPITVTAEIQAQG